MQWKLKTVIRAKIIRSVGVLYSSLCSLALLLSFCLSSSLSLSFSFCVTHWALYLLCLLCCGCSSIKLLFGFAVFWLYSEKPLRRAQSGHYFPSQNPLAENHCAASIHLSIPPSISSRLSRVLQMFFSLAPMVHWAHQHLIFKEQLNTKSSEWASVTQCNSVRQWIGSLWVTLIITYLWSYICVPM